MKQGMRTWVRVLEMCKNGVSGVRLGFKNTAKNIMCGLIGIPCLKTQAFVIVQGTLKAWALIKLRLPVGVQDFDDSNVQHCPVTDGSVACPTWWSTGRSIRGVASAVTPTWTCVQEVIRFALLPFLNLTLSRLSPSATNTFRSRILNVW